jgi:hypothetical protein
MEAAQAEPAATTAASGIANVETTTAIVSKLHKRRRVLSGLPVKSIFAAAGKSGLVGNAMRQTAKTGRLNRTAERTSWPSARMSQIEPEETFRRTLTRAQTGSVL